MDPSVDILTRVMLGEGQKNLRIEFVRVGNVGILNQDDDWRNLVN